MGQDNWRGVIPSVHHHTSVIIASKITYRLIFSHLPIFLGRLMHPLLDAITAKARVHIVQTRP